MADASSVRQDRATRRSDRTHDEPTDLAPDLFGVTSRVSWSAIVAGAVIALACYTALTFLFAAIGITMADLGARGQGSDTGRSRPPSSRLWFHFLSAAGSPRR